MSGGGTGTGRRWAEGGGGGKGCCACRMLACAHACARSPPRIKEQDLARTHARCAARAVGRAGHDLITWPQSAAQRRVGGRKCCLTWWPSTAEWCWHAKTNDPKLDRIHIPGMKPPSTRQMCRSMAPTPRRDKRTPAPSRAALPLPVAAQSQFAAFCSIARRGPQMFHAEVAELV
jgi:hypothetical protein